MDVIADRPSNAQAAEPAEQGDGALDNPAVGWTPSPQPCSVPQRAITGVISSLRTWSR